MLGLALKKIWATIRLKNVLIGFVSYVVVFSLVSLYMQILLYSGILHISGKTKFYQLSQNISSLFDISEIFSNLQILSFPFIGLIMLLAGIGVILWGLKLFSSKVKER
jgi:hypothetical protein